MTNELMVPDQSDVPSYIKDPVFAKAANEEAAAGISTGFSARVKLSGKQFTLVDGNGDETPFPPAKMIVGPDQNNYLPVIILRAKKALTKAWYASAFNPAVEAQAPDCFSNDAERPDPSAIAPQGDTCAACPMNAFGSGKDQAGNATQGKACADTKLLAVFVPGFGVHSFKIPPATLKNFGLYVKQLSANGIPLGTVKTLVGFDLTATFPVLVFRFGGYIGENLIPKLAELSTSTEAEEAIGGITVTPAAKQVEAPEKPKEIVSTVADDDLGFDASQGTTAPAAQDPALAATAPVQKPVVEPSAQEVTDDQLRKELGL